MNLIQFIICFNTARCSFDSTGARSAIIDVLQEFILGDNPSAVLENIKNEGSTKSVCGRVFKMNEPYYSCRECGMDPTCVLCVNCFKQSAHRHHKYKMGASFGGGCCDCGDSEAWKQDHYCDEHKVNEIETNSIHSLSVLIICICFLSLINTIAGWRKRAPKCFHYRQHARTL